MVMVDDVNLLTTQNVRNGLLFEKRLNIRRRHVSNLRRAARDFVKPQRHLGRPQLSNRYFLSGHTPPPRGLSSVSDRRCRRAPNTASRSGLRTSLCPVWPSAVQPPLGRSRWVKAYWMISGPILVSPRNGLSRTITGANRQTDCRHVHHVDLDAKALCGFTPAEKGCGDDKKKENDPEVVGDVKRGGRKSSRPGSFDLRRILRQVSAIIGSRGSGFRQIFLGRANGDPEIVQIFFAQAATEKRVASPGAATHPGQHSACRTRAPALPRRLMVPVRPVLAETVDSGRLAPYRLIGLRRARQSIRDRATREQMRKNRACCVCGRLRRASRRPDVRWPTAKPNRLARNATKPPTRPNRKAEIARIAASESELAIQSTTLVSILNMRRLLPCGRSVEEGWPVV